jgi:hypothetical protein
MQQPSPRETAPTFEPDTEVLPLPEIHHPASKPNSPGPLVRAGGKEMGLVEARDKVRFAGAWFFWIAGLSVVNTLAALFGTEYGMILGLGVTQFFDAFTRALVEESAGSGQATRMMGLGLTLLVAGFFTALGVFARRARTWAFLAGILAYGADAVLFLLVRDWIAIGFHVFVLVMLWGGLSMTRAVAAATAPEAPAPRLPVPAETFRRAA